MSRQAPIARHSCIILKAGTRDDEPSKKASQLITRSSPKIEPGTIGYFVVNIKYEL
jgi:hypothetical protein